MRHFLRTIIGLSIVLLALLVTALSCNKVGDDKNNANNSGSGSGGTGGGGTGGGGTGGGGTGGGGVTLTIPGCVTGTTGTNICFENFDTNVAVPDDANANAINLKASGLPTAVSADIANTDMATFKTAATDKFKRAFDLTIKVDGAVTTEGLLLVGPGNLAGANAFSIDKRIDQGLTDYTPAQRKEGIVSEAATTAGTFLQAGWNILMPFMSTTAPPNGSADASPFAFTATTGTDATKPLFFCRSTITEATGDAAVVAGTKLTGGHKASCYVAVSGANFTDRAGEVWLDEFGGNFKQRFNIAIAGVKTDGKTIAGTTGIGLSGADDAGKVAAFKDGISTTEMTALTGANPNAYKKVAIELVRGALPVYLPPAAATIVFENFDNDVAEMVGDTIQLKASGLPTAVSADIANTDIATFKAAATDKFKRAFDLTVKVGNTASAEGLLLVGPGSLKVNDFYIRRRVDQGLSDYTAAQRKEGIATDAPTVAVSANNLFPAGWNILGSFMSPTLPNDASSAGADASPFAFSQTSGAYATKPVFFCRSTISTITDGATTGAGTVQANTKLTGGHKATCYVGVVGDDFTQKAGNDWLDTAASDNFKKTFNIAIAGLKTDGKEIKDIGFRGADDAAKVASFRDGISQAEMKKLVMENQYGYKKVAVEMVRGTLPVFVPTTTTDIVFENFDNDVAEMVGGTIQLKASGLPPAFSTDILAVDINHITGSARTGSFKRAFDIKIKDRGLAAREGLILVGPGNLADANAFSIDRGVAQGLSDYPRSQRKGGIASQAQTTPYLNGLVQAGWNIFGSFMNPTLPNSAATAAAGASPFAFSQTSGAFGTKPILFCRTTLSAITSDAAVTATTQLTGGETASCYVAVLGVNFLGKAGDDWLKTAAGNNFKKKFNIAISGIKTDGKTIAGTSGIGLPGADDAAKIANFKDGISTTEMTALAAANPKAYTNIAIEMVRGTLPTYTPPTGGDIKFENFDNTVAVQLADGTIQLKADGFPTGGAVGPSVLGSIDVAKTAGAANFKRAFDITISTASKGGSDATGGLVWVGTGNLADITAFTINKRVDQAVTDYSIAEREEGIVSDAARATDEANGFVKAGWNVFGVFMSQGEPYSNPTADPANSPFSFTPVSGTKPVLVCRTVASSVTSAAAVTATTQLAGSETASCYVGALGKAFTGKVANDWLGALSGAGNIKKKFNIAVAGIQTDAKTIGGATDIGLPGADDAAKVAAFTDGISSADITYMSAANPSAYTNVAVELVRGGFTYTPPAAALRFDNFDTYVRTNTTGDTIQIKARAFPTTAANASVTASANDLVTAPAGSLIGIFDIAITDTGGNAASGGLIMVGPGSYTKVDDFADTTGHGALPADFKEGYASGAMTNAAATATEFQPVGWSHYGVFMNDTAPTAVGADTSPLAFTASGGSQPFLFCRSTLSEFNGGRVTDFGTTFSGGQRARCYIGSKGGAFSGQSATWLTTAASATFKKTFNIAIGAINTDMDVIKSIMLSSSAKEQAIADGLDSTEIADIVTRYPSAFKKMAVEIVADGLW